MFVVCSLAYLFICVALLIVWIFLSVHLICFCLVDFSFVSLFDYLFVLYCLFICLFVSLIFLLFVCPLNKQDLQLQYHNAESMAELIIGQRHSLWISALFRHLNNVLSQCYYTRDKRKSSAVSIGLTWIILCPRNVLNYCFHSPPMDFVNDCTMVVPVPCLDEGGGWC